MIGGSVGREGLTELTLELASIEQIGQRVMSSQVDQAPLELLVLDKVLQDQEGADRCGVGKTAT